jgi:hypothetical protein
MSSRKRNTPPRPDTAPPRTPPESAVAAAQPPPALATTEPQGPPEFTETPECPYCCRALQDPDQGTTNNGLYEVRCECGAWIELLRHSLVAFRIRQCSPTVPPRVFLGS